MTDAPRTPHAPPHTGDGREQLTRFFDWIRSSGVTRGSDRWLAGVCGAIARRTGLDPMIVRGIVVVLAILGGPVLFAYAVGWAFLPDATGRIHAEQLVRGVVEPATIAVIALIVFTFVPVTRGLWWEGPPVGWGMPDWLEATLTVGWSMAVTIGIIWLVVFFLRRVPAPGGGFPRAGYGSGAYGTAGTASFVGTPAGSTEAPAGAAFPGAASVIATGTPAGPGIATAPAPPRPEADAPRSAWDAWQEQNRAWQSQSRTWRAEHRAWRATHDRQRHPGAGFTSIVLGIALAAGAIAAGVNSAGAWSNASLLIGIAFTLGVLALGIIVAGVRGRDSGALGGFSFLAVLALLVFGVFPSGTQFTPFGAPTWAVSSTTAGAVPGYAIIAGNPSVDLSDLGGAPRFGESRIIDVWIGFGQTDLILPADRAVLVETNALIGGVEYDDQDSVDRGGLFFHDSRTVNGPSSRPVAQIRVWSLVGQVAVTTSEE